MQLTAMGAAGVGWLRESLSQGALLSSAALAGLPLDDGEAAALVPEDFHGSPVFTESAGVRAAGADAGLARWLAASGRAGTLVIEDELARPGDPVLSRLTAPYLTEEGRVYWFVGIEPSAAERGVTRLHESSSGYPTNAFVLSVPVDHVTAIGPLAERLPTILRAIVVAAFDAESFVIWTPPRQEVASATNL
jgi:hypothetical protein